MNVVGSYLAESFWPSIHRQAKDHPCPQFAPFSGLGQRLSDGLAPADVETWLNSALGRATTLADTHPSLRDRLAALGAEARLALPGPDETVDRLGAVLSALTSEFDEKWRTGIQDAWAAH